MPDPDPESFRRQAEGRPRGPLAELFGYLLRNKKWWLIPIALVLILAAILVVLGGSGIAPFIYTLF